MKDNFRNRINTQREVLGLINKHGWEEELFGLSEKAINRWKDKNNIQDNIIEIIIEISNRLFFLGVRSQEQITCEYLKVSEEIAENIDKLRNILEL